MLLITSYIFFSFLYTLQETNQSDLLIIFERLIFKDYSFTALKFFTYMKISTRDPVCNQENRFILHSLNTYLQFSFSAGEVVVVAFHYIVSLQRG